MKQSYRQTSAETVYTSRVLSLVEETVELPSGVTKKHLTIEHPGAVVILPITISGSILFVDQYRHSLKTHILELPAGTLNPKEDPLDCAKREICEEVGFSAARWEPLGVLYPAPGFCNERQHLFFAAELTPKQLPPDEDEIIEVVEIGVDDAIAQMLDGRIFDAKSIATLFRAYHSGLLGPQAR